MTTPEDRTKKHLHQALAAADGLETFQRLPQPEQDKFLGWITKARDDEAHWRRIDILVLAMRMSPPRDPEVELPPATPLVR